MNTQQIILTSRPRGVPTLDNFAFEHVLLPDIHQDEVLLQGLYFSVDPYMRGRMNDRKSYVAPFQVGQPIEGGVVAKVLKSKSGNFKPGDLVTAGLPWRVLNIVPSIWLQKIDTTHVPASYYLGILGMPGLTAYIGLMDIGKPKAGETVVVSGAAGAVGIIVGQIAKIQGCRVIGIAGSDEKTRSLKEEFGFDEAINYKSTSNMKAVISHLCPSGVDVYFDNVGGEISDAVIRNINFHARIPLCGQISLYNSSEFPRGPRLQPMLLSRSVLMQGFIVSNYQIRFPEAIQQLNQWLKEGRLKYTETIVHGFDQLPTALLGLFKGDNIGKMIVEA
jgi:NADPH-dependent curcumin reductase CurA